MIRAALFALVVAGCALVQPPSSDGPLVTVEAIGGMCPTGTCRSVVAIEADGRVHQTEPEAIQISQAHNGPIHLMVTDILMDGMSGVELAERLSFKRPEMRVLFATGYPAGLTEGSQVANDAAHLLKKPFSGRELAAKVREVLETAD